MSNLREPIIKGYLKDIKANKRRWCVLQGNRLHIFKTQDDPAMMIIDLLGCDIGVDDKKKISYSFRLTPKEGPGVSLAIEDGQDLSPWMSAIMAAVVRRGSVDRPISPLESAYSLEQARAEKAARGFEVDGGTEMEEADVENVYEEPVDQDTVSSVHKIVLFLPQREAACLSGKRVRLAIQQSRSGHLLNLFSVFPSSNLRFTVKSPESHLARRRSPSN